MTAPNEARMTLADEAFAVLDSLGRPRTAPTEEPTQ